MSAAAGRMKNRDPKSKGCKLAALDRLHVHGTSQSGRAVFVPSNTLPAIATAPIRTFCVGANKEKTTAKKKEGTNERERMPTGMSLTIEFGRRILASRRCPDTEVTAQQSRSRSYGTAQ
jgi:hypothetical protein